MLTLFQLKYGSYLLRKYCHQHKQPNQTQTNKSPPWRFRLLFNIVKSFTIAFGHLVRLKHLFAKGTLANSTLANRKNGDPEDVEVLLKNVHVHCFSTVAMCALLRNQKLKQQPTTRTENKHSAFWLVNYI